MVLKHHKSIQGNQKHMWNKYWSFSEIADNTKLVFLPISLLLFNLFYLIYSSLISLVEMLLYLLSNYYVLKELICQDKYKKVKLKLKHI